MDNGTLHAPAGLTASHPGRVVGHEIALLRPAHGAGADRDRRVGVDGGRPPAGWGEHGEQRAAALLESLTGRPRRRDRLLHRPPSWRVLHSVPLGDGADIDHVLVGPPGVCTVTARHHRGGLVELDDDALVVDGFRTTAVPDARREAGWARAQLVPRLPPVLRTLPVRPVVALVGAAMQVRRWPDDVIVATEGALVAALRGLAPVLDAWAVDEVYDVARRTGTWIG